MNSQSLQEQRVLTCPNDTVSSWMYPFRLQLDDDSPVLQMNDTTPIVLKGRLETFGSDSWGTVCDDMFDQAAANVACSMFNMTQPATTASTYDARGPEDMPIVLDDV